MCLLKKSEVENDITEDVIEIDENQSIDNRVTTMQDRKSEEERFQKLNERKYPEASTNMKSKDMISEDKESNSSYVNEYDEFKMFF